MAPSSLPETPRSSRVAPLQLPETPRIAKRAEPLPERSRLFRAWQATNAGPAADVLFSLLPGGRSLVPTPTLGTPVSSRPSPGPSTPSTPLMTPPLTSPPAQRPSTVSSSPVANSIGTGAISICPPDGANFLQRRSFQRLSEAVEYTEKFKGCCRRRFGSLVRAWRQFLDPKGLGRVGFVQFCDAARTMGFERVSIIWKVLDCEGSKFITLGMWDPPAYRALMEFRHICFREYGGPLEAFRFALDPDGNGCCRKEVLANFLEYADYTGCVDTLWNSLDECRGGFITVAELQFLLNWTGEAFSAESMDRDFGFHHEKLRRLQEQRKKERSKRKAEMSRQKQERDSIVHGRTIRHTQAPPPYTSEAIHVLVNRKKVAETPYSIDYSSEFQSRGLDDGALNSLTSEILYMSTDLDQELQEPPSLSESLQFNIPA